MRSRSASRSDALLAISWRSRSHWLCVTPQEAMTQCMQSREHQYVFEPVCASVLLRRNTSKEPLRSRSCPRIEGHVQLEPMSLRLSQVGEPPAALPAGRASVPVPASGLSVVVLGLQVQYQQVMRFLKELDRRERGMLYRRWRPKVPVSNQ